MQNTGKFWIVIGISITIIGLVFSIIISNINEKQIEKLVTNCEESGGQVELERQGFLLTTGYHFECNK